MVPDPVPPPLEQLGGEACDRRVGHSTESTSTTSQRAQRANEHNEPTSTTSQRAHNKVPPCGEVARSIPHAAKIYNPRSQPQLAHAPSESLPGNTLHLLHARANTSESVNLIAIITGLVSAIIAIIGLILGYIYWKYPRAASLDSKVRVWRNLVGLGLCLSDPVLSHYLSRLPILAPPGSINVSPQLLASLAQCMALAHPAPTPPEHEIDPELGRVTALPSGPDTVEPEPRPVSTSEEDLEADREKFGLDPRL
ncbi:hypothetical protein DFP73DRAFT_622351 [Morchella snyderi]|nr:hypothetical protein DFP73DRAFT_622351 [Morchella snyderi]